MRIALLSYEYPPDTGFGGIGTYTWYQARALVRLGHDVRVVAGALEPGTTHHEQEGVRITRVLAPGPVEAAAAGLDAVGSGWSANRLRTAWSAFVALRELLEREDYDIVEYPDCGADGMVVSTMLPVRTCVRFHSPARLIMGTYGAHPDDVEVTGAFEQVGIRLADVRTSPSRFLADEVAARLAVPPPIHVVPNGIDLELFDRGEPLDVVDRFGLPSDPAAVIVLFAGRLERRKGAHLLPEICGALLRRYPHVHVVLAGTDGDDVVARSIRPPLEADRLGDRLHHLGRVELAEVRALLRYADVHLHPTVWDNAPYACIEAMAAGCAVVASDVGGLPELIDDGRTGLLAAADDAASFVAAVGRLVEDADLRDRLGAAARRDVEEHHRDVAVARRTVEVWQGGGSAHAPGLSRVPRPSTDR